MPHQVLSIDYHGASGVLYISMGGNARMTLLILHALSLSVSHP